MNLGRPFKAGMKIKDVFDLRRVGDA